MWSRTWHLGSESCRATAFQVAQAALIARATAQYGGEYRIIGPQVWHTGCNTYADLSGRYDVVHVKGGADERE